MSARVELDSVEVRYGGVIAVDRVSLEVAPRSLVALVGPSGCGKTSLLRAIAGFERPSAGSVRIDGVVVASESVWVEPERRAVGMVFQEGALFPHMTVAENVRYGVRRRPDAEARTREVLDLVGLGALRARYPDELSGGQQQRAALARALAPQPKLVLLDEPFAGLDSALRQRIRADLQRILRDAGTTAVLVTHDQQEALEIADVVAVMDHGRILQVATPPDVYESPASRHVAELIGEGESVACGLTGELLERLAGQPIADPGAGSWIFIRPEDLAIAAPGEKGADAVIESTRYFGHDALHRIRVEGLDCRLQLRTSGAVELSSGTAIRVRLRPKHYAVFRDGTERLELEVKEQSGA
ncbi:MAG TPA: ABC transporter ATP-binding protein [Thermoanaerobaculia bacterium]|nr:ABC transporter ATP-binding protein [Thermoanaerobaculia bacterium]